MIGCFKFLIGYSVFENNQTYPLSYLYNWNEHRVYNKMNIGDWWCEQQKDHLSQTIVLPILIASTKIVICLRHRDQILLPIYITIGYLDAKSRQRQTCSSNLLFASIPIVHKCAKDSNKIDKDLKAKVYHLALKPMFKRMISIFWCNRIIILIVSALFKYCNQGTEILYKTALNNIAILFLQG